MIIDLNNLQNNEDLKCDICIVGSGAAGTILFDKLSKSKFDVVLLESGLKYINYDHQKLDEAQILLQGKRRENVKVDIDNYRLRGLGGTTNHWGGECVKFYEIDFLKRNWVNHSGWPINLNDLNPYYKKANSYVEIATNIFDGRVWEQIGLKSNPLNLNPNKVETHFRHRSGFRKKSSFKPINFKKYLFDTKNKNNKNKIIYNATLTKLVSKNNNHIDYGIIKSLNGAEKKIISKKFILCAGGFEVARILLNSGNGKGLGNDNDLVGRFFLGHLGSHDLMKLICNTKEMASKVAWNYSWFDVGKNRSRSHIAFDKNFQEKNSLLNTGIRFIGDENTEHPVYKVMQIRRDIINKNFENINLSTEEFLFILNNMDKVLINWKRGLLDPRGVERPMLKNMTIFYIAEQEPNKNNRIYLSNEKDILGMNKMILDSHSSEKDKENVKKVSKHLASVFGEAKVGKIVVNENLEEKFDLFEFDHICTHPAGTTRMSASKEDGVVDKYLRSHFVDNLYICSSSTFPTIGCEPPTYTISALAIRLSEHLIAN